MAISRRGACQECPERSCRVRAPPESVAVVCPRACDVEKFAWYRAWSHALAASTHVIFRAGRAAWGPPAMSRESLPEMLSECSGFVTRALAVAFVSKNRFARKDTFCVDQKLFFRMLGLSRAGAGTESPWI